MMDMNMIFLCVQKTKIKSIKTILTINFDIIGEMGNTLWSLDTSVFILLFSILTHCVFKRAKKGVSWKTENHISLSWILILPSHPWGGPHRSQQEKKCDFRRSTWCGDRCGRNTLSSYVKGNEARLKVCSLSQDQHLRSSLSDCWWSTIRHIFKTLKVLVIKNVYYISFWGIIPSMVFILKSDGHTCVFTWSLKDKHCKYWITTVFQKHAST